MHRSEGGGFVTYDLVPETFFALLATFVVSPSGILSGPESSIGPGSKTYTIRVPTTLGESFDFVHGVGANQDMAESGGKGGEEENSCKQAMARYQATTVHRPDLEWEKLGPLCDVEADMDPWAENRASRDATPGTPEHCSRAPYGQVICKHPS